MTDSNGDLLDRDVRLAWRRFHGKATAEQMLSWINHNFGRGYAPEAFAACLTRLRSESQPEARRATTST